MVAIPTRPALLLVALASFAAMAPSARAQVESREGIALQNQILELRRDLGAQRGQGGGGAPVYVAPPTGDGGDITATLLTRVTQLEDEVRRLRGRLDEEENARQRQGEDLNKQIGDLNFKLGNGAAPVAPPPPRGPTSGAVVPLPPLPAPAARRTPEKALADGNAAYARHDYAAAQAAAKEVLANGRSPRVADAQYLLAQSLAGARDYQASAVAYDDAYRRNPKGSRAQDSLVGLANSLAALNERKAACETLDKARVEFPVPRPDARPALAAARLRAGCPA